MYLGIAQTLEFAGHRRAVGIDQVLAAKQQLIVRWGVLRLDVAVPERRIGRQRPQRRRNEQSREAIEMRRQFRIAAAGRMLIRLDADLEVAAIHQLRHGEAVVIDELEFARRRDHDVRVLQVAVGDAGEREFLDEPGPVASRSRQGGGIAAYAATAHPVEERFARDPVHDDERIPFPVAGRADAGGVELEADEASRPLAGQKRADGLVAFDALGHFGGERAKSDGVPGRVCSLEHDGERPRPRPRLAEFVAVNLDRAIRPA